MALKPSKLKQIPQRKKDLAFGYLRENEHTIKSNYPQLIKYLVLIYSNAQDDFDPNTTHQSLEINGNIITSKQQGDHVSYLKNVVSEGIHIWKFQWSLDMSYTTFTDSQIGVWNTKSGDPILKDVYVDCMDDDARTGYIIITHGRSTDPAGDGRWSKEWFTKPESGSIIEMELDLNELTLKFKIDDEIRVEMKNIEKTSYRAVVGPHNKGETFTLLSYQDFYK